MHLVLAYIFSILILYGNVIYRPIMSLTTENVIKHSVQYLNDEVDIMLSVMSHWNKSANCHNKVTESIKIAKLSYFIVYLE